LAADSGSERRKKEQKRSGKGLGVSKKKKRKRGRFFTSKNSSTDTFGFSVENSFLDLLTGDVVPISEEERDPI